MAAIPTVWTRRKLWFCLLMAALGAALRLCFALNFPVISGDSLIYADIAHNWLHHGILGVTENRVPVPELIRLPGYPGFLATVFAAFGDNAFWAVAWAQIVVDLATCGVIALLAGELASARSRARVQVIAFTFACLCPFTANYAALPLTETLAVTATAAALLFALRTLRIQRLREAVLCGVFAGYGVLLRPDNGILLAVICAGLLAIALARRQARLIRAAVLIGIIAVLPLIPWTIRNWKVFHVFQPLAPRYANQPDEFVPRGFNRWVKTWMADYASVEEVYWRVDDPEDSPEIELLPDRAFDDADQRQRTAALFAQLSDAGNITEAIDNGFDALAHERIRRHPLRYYVVLPAMRIADMWLRPRIEMLPLERRWWEWEEPNESWIAVGFGALNLLWVIAAAVGAWHSRRSPGTVLLVGFVVARTLFLGTLENPEPRYTLQMFPVVLALAAIAAGRTFGTASESARTGS
jgi:pimeloyl-ACP methyl ester carboxylesterase